MDPTGTIASKACKKILFITILETKCEIYNFGLFPFFHLFINSVRKFFLKKESEDLILKKVPQSLKLMFLYHAQVVNKCGKLL